jgi:SPP1 gp7 family putative phage head morphogenesis protein
MPTTPERLIEIATRHISHNERLKSHNVKEYSEFLEDMKNSVTNQLTNKDLTKFSRDRLLALEKNIASDLKEINQAVAGTLKSQAKDLAKYESEFEVKALSDVVDYSFNLPSTSQLNSAVFKTPLAGIEGPMKGKLLDAIIKDWSDRTVDRVNNVITAGYYQGKTTTAIVKDVVGTGANFTGGTLAQVKRDTEGLVRTSLQHAANQARQETWNQNKDIVKGVRILATLDSRTSTICRTLDGQVYALDEGPRPPFHINCLPGDTNISTCTSVSNVYKRPYKGILVDIQTVSGYSISITPNHPILTDSGWKAASDINCFDKLACVTSPHMFTKNNKDCVNTTFSKFFRTCKVSVNSSFITNRPSSTEDFHGDGISDSYIDIVNINSFTWDSIRESFYNFRKNQRFPQRPSIRFSLSRFCSFPQFFLTNFSTSNSLMCCFSKISNFLRGSIFHPFKLLFRGISKLTKSFFKQPFNRHMRTSKTQTFGNTTNPYSTFISRKNQFLGFFREIDFSKHSNRNTCFFKNLTDFPLTNAIDLFDLLNRQPIDGIKFDDVINVSSRQLTDFIHVYNLQNEGNWYVSNNIITHNCRTSTVSVLDERFKILDKDSTRSARDPETGEVYKVDSQRTYYDWLKGQPANVQDSILGPTRGKLLRDGGLTSKRFAELQLSKNFQPMTLAEIKAIEPIAFEKANIDWEKAGTAPKPIDLRYSPEGKGVSKVTGPDASFRPPTSKPTVDQVQEQWAAIQDSNEFKSKVQAKADLDKKVIAARTAYSDIDTAFTNALKGDPDWDKVAKLKSKKRELGSRVVELASNQKQLAKELKQYQHEKIHTLVFPTTNAPLNARISDQYVKTKTAKSNFEKLKTEASKMLHADVVKKIGPVDIIVKKGSRAYYTNGRKEIGLANLTKTETFIHEFGHALEYQFPNAKKQALAFRKSRIGNEKLSPIFKGKKEVGWKDGFFDHYCGKYYEDGATEIISMGLEKMYKDPIIFLNKDPEYFEFIIKVMWGDL